MKKQIDELLNIYKSIKSNIEKQLSNFKKIWNHGKEEDIFTELAFCILTPQSKARSGWEAICCLKDKDLLFNGKYDEINHELRIVRFKNKKAEYLINARNKFMSNGASLKEKLKLFDDVYKKREWLVNEVKGYGYKEASHFLRNVGFGEEIAILDRHILKNLKLFGVIDELPKSMTRNKYLEIEEKLKRFGKDINIPTDHLDFVLWYKEAGEIFK